MEQLFLCCAERVPTPSSAPADPAGSPRTRPIPSCPAVPSPPPGGQLGACPPSPGLGVAFGAAASKAAAPTAVSSLYRLFSDARECVGPRGGDDSALSSLG